MGQPDYLIRGSDYLAQHPEFVLVGRTEELGMLSRILMRKRANSVLLVGSGGVGCTALCLGLELAKQDPDTAFDLVNKRIFWLDTDGLFSSGNLGVMNKNFQKLLRRLSRYSDTLLIIEDMRDFIEATRNNGCTNFINALMRAVENGKFQAILETRDDDLEIVLKCHSSMHEYYTMLDLKEPEREPLAQIVKEAAMVLERHHNVQITQDAIDAAVELTSKYRVREMSLSRAQPERSLNLLDRALAAYRHDAHDHPPGVEEKQQQLRAMVSSKASSDGAGGNGLESRLEDEIEQLWVDWKTTQAELRKFHNNQTDGEETLRALEDQLAAQLEREERERESREQDPEAEAEPKEFKSFNMRIAEAGYESEAVNALRADIKKVQEAIDDNKDNFSKLTAQINAHLALGPAHILREFSQISGIPANKLNQDERAKLINLDAALSQRVFGQDHAVQRLADAVRVARVGLKDAAKPQASFMFLGPSGVGKTEIAKALTAALHDDERALLRFDMSEYMEKHAVAKLIGAPPGYEGYEAGGILTNAMRRNPHVVILFDEIEKAHPDVFNVFLQVLDDGRLTDNRGLTVSFGEAIILMTTNIGQKNFLNPDLSFEEATAETMDELDSFYRPEFLNRFNGRQNIVCFNKLGLPVIERIARREIDKLNAQIRAQDRDLELEISEQSLTALCKDHYDPVNGARGIPGYFASRIHPAVANALLESESTRGRMEVIYEAASRRLEVVHSSAAETATPPRPAAQTDALEQDSA